MLQNKTILIIGGTSGFGYDVAKQAAQKQANLIITGRDTNKLEQAVLNLRKYNTTVEGFELNIEQGDEVNAFFSQIGKIDHLVSTVGSFMGGGFLDASIETITHAIDYKFYKNLCIARAAASHINHEGSMVFTSGCGGRPDNASGAIIGNDSIRTMAKGLAVELAPHVRVNAVAPTWTKTPLWRDMTEADLVQTEQNFAKDIPLGRTAKIEEVAMTYIFLMENSFITGQTIDVDGGLTLVS